MVQVLTSVIEWFAMLVLTSIGIEYEPDACQAEQPTEYRQTATVFYTDIKAGWDSVNIEDCAGRLLMHTQSEPVYVTSPRIVYDS